MAPSSLLLSSLGLPPTRPLHLITYLLTLPLLTITILVFLNSSLSFLLLHLYHSPTSSLGSKIGTLGFIDELVALIFAPLWGFLSDTRLGTRGVAVCGFIGMALGLGGFTVCGGAMAGLGVVRAVFAMGGSAAAVMVTAILPELVVGEGGKGEDGEEGVRGNRREGRLAGLVGMFSGLGALLALGILLPLPVRFVRWGWGEGEAVRVAYWIVAGVAVVGAVGCWVGLPGQRVEEDEGRGVIRGWGEMWREVKMWAWVKIWGGDPWYLHGHQEQDSDSVSSHSSRKSPGAMGLWEAVKLARRDGRVLVAYIGGFVARASSVGISLFIPLLITHHFVSTGRCTPSSSPEDTKRDCRKAYILASTLTGTSQLTALLLAPVFGILTDHCSATPYLRNTPLMTSSICGIIGFTLFSLLPTPEAPIAFFYAALIGASQIGAIVSSLGLLSQGVVDSDSDFGSNSDDGITNSATTISSPSPAWERPSEESPLLGTGAGSGIGDGNGGWREREKYKGSIAGVYSLAGAAAILLLTKVGGKGFDKVAPGLPFWMLAGFNGGLLVIGLGEGVGTWWRESKREGR